MQPRTLLARNAAHANLTPWERTTLRLGEGVLLAALVGGLAVLYTQLKEGHVDWNAVLVAFIMAGLGALLKLLTAWNEPPLPVTPPAA